MNECLAEQYGVEGPASTTIYSGEDIANSGKDSVNADGTLMNRSDMYSFLDTENRTININGDDTTTDKMISSNNHEVGHLVEENMSEAGADYFGKKVGNALNREFGSSSDYLGGQNWDATGYGNYVASQANYVKPCANISSTLTFELPGFTPSPLESGMLITRIPTEGNFKLAGFTPTSEEDEFKLAGFSPTPEDMIVTHWNDEISTDSNSEWKNSDGSPKWPENDGFLGEPRPATLLPGARVDRYGRDKGYFVAPEGTPFGERSLPEQQDSYPYRAYEVLKPIEVKVGETAPCFGQAGGGTQYMFDKNINELVQDESLEEIKK